MTRMNRAARLAAACGAAALGVLATGCRTRSFLSTRDEVNLGKQGSRQIEQQIRVDTADADAERVRRIGDSLLAHMDRRDVPYSFRVLEGRDINAFSLPGGPIYVYRGLLDMVGDDDDALACVLGHEAGHVNGRHAARMISSNLVNNVLISVLLPNATTQNLAGLANELMGLRYSREDEYDADRRGLSYAYHAGYDPEGMIRFFKKLELLEKREGSGGPEWLRTHPVTSARVARAEEIIAQKDYRYGH